MHSRFEPYKKTIVILLLVAISFFLGLNIGSTSNSEKDDDEYSGVIDLPFTSGRKGSIPADREFQPDSSLTEFKAPIIYGDTTEYKDVDLAIFWGVWNTINEKYVGSNGLPTAEARVYGALQGLMSSLDDPHSVFFPPQEHKMFEEDTSGNFQGVGIEIAIRDDLLTVVAPLKDTPAYRAGILSGDIIVAINGTTTYDMTTDEAVNIIRGPKGTDVILTVVREEAYAPIDIVITRDNIAIPILDSELRDDGVYVISLYSFTLTAPELFRSALEEFLKSGATKLVLDLRGNPGGFLDSAIDIASWFLPLGEVVAIESYGSPENEVVYRSHGYDVFTDEFELVILIDQGSASAAEILAGALHEHEVATLIGKNSFGKGSIQELIKITPDTSVKITIAQWLTPESNSISDGGLTPDIEIDITMDDIQQGEDPQLDAAVEYLLTN